MREIAIVGPGPAVFETEAEAARAAEEVQAANWLADAWHYVGGPFGPDGEWGIAAYDDADDFRGFIAVPAAEAVA